MGPFTCRRDDIAIHTMTRLDDGDVTMAMTRYHEADDVILKYGNNAMVLSYDIFEMLKHLNMHYDYITVKKGHVQ